MKIYRLETSMSEGPYVNTLDGDAYAHRDKAMHLVYAVRFECHPTPQEEGLREYISNPNYVCGFSSMESFENWFPQTSWIHFDNAGFELSVYDIDDEHIDFGQRQVMFNREHANFTGSLILSDLLAKVAS